MTRPVGPTSPPSSRNLLGLRLALTALGLNSPNVRRGLPVGAKRSACGSRASLPSPNKRYSALSIAPKEMQADVIIVEIDSPGGMLQPSMEIANRLTRDLN